MKLEIEEIKKFKCSDGLEFTDKTQAVSHEEILFFGDVVKNGDIVWCDENFKECDLVEAQYVQVYTWEAVDWWNYKTQFKDRGYIIDRLGFWSFDKKENKFVQLPNMQIEKREVKMAQKYITKKDKEILEKLEFEKKKWDINGKRIHVPHLGLNKEVYLTFKQMSADGVEISTPLAIYCYLYSFTFDGRKIDSQVISKAVENYYGICRETVHRNINILTNYGLLEVRNNGYKKVNTYFFPKELKKKIKTTTYIQDKFHHRKIWDSLEPKERLKIIPLYIWMTSFKDEKLEFVNLRMNQISKDLHINKRKVKLIIEQLEDLGLLSKIKNSDNLYIYSLFWKVKIKTVDTEENIIKKSKIKSDSESEIDLAFTKFLQQKTQENESNLNTTDIELEDFDW